jgi:hypothetical protein
LFNLAAVRPVNLQRRYFFDAALITSRGNAQNVGLQPIWKILKRQGTSLPKWQDGLQTGDPTWPVRQRDESNQRPRERWAIIGIEPRWRLGK